MINLWTTFHKNFKIDDELIIVNEDDEVFVGKLKQIEEDFCIIKQPHKKRSDMIWWDDIRFIAHEGFPIKKLSGGEKIYKEPPITKNVHGIKCEICKLHYAKKNICELASCEEFCYYGDLIKKEHPKIVCNFCVENERVEIEDKITVVYGDPFLIEVHKAKIINPASKIDGYEQSICMNAKDGAYGELYIPETIFYMD